MMMSKKQQRSTQFRRKYLMPFGSDHSYERFAEISRFFKMDFDVSVSKSAGMSGTASLIPDIKIAFTDVTSNNETTHQIIMMDQKKMILHTH